MSGSGKDFPDWETLYKSQKVETMPWYNKNFDSDLEKDWMKEGLLTVVKDFLTYLPFYLLQDMRPTMKILPYLS